MKNPCEDSILRKKFLLGFGISFVPYIIPNGRIIFALPFYLLHSIIFSYGGYLLNYLYLPLPAIICIITGIVQLKRRREGASGWILGAFFASAVGEILFWHIGIMAP